MISLDLPTGYSVRAPLLEDARDIADLVNEVNVAEIGIPLTSAEETRDDLTSPGRDKEDDVLLVADDGAIVGYLTLWADVDPFTEVLQLAFVRPALWGQGLSAWLLRLGEVRARRKVDRAPGDAPVFLRVGRWAVNDAAGRLFASLGYTYARTFHEMRLELGDPVVPFEIPDGIELRTFHRDADARAVHAALEEAFEDHWGHRFDPFDRWLHERIEGESSGFDAGLWFLALDGEEVVGAVLCRETTPSTPHAGYVDALGVRRGWQRRGVGGALLMSAFGELRRRGIAAVELGVDSQNETGATHLYERVGMRPLRVVEFWQKELLHEQ